MNKKIIGFFKIFWRKYNEDKIFKESAALTYVTLLGFIPFLIFMVFFLPELPFLRIESQIGDLVKTIFVPESAEVIFVYISKIANRNISFNLFSFIVLLVTSYSLFQIINTSFDNILNAHEQRHNSFFYDIVKFFGMTIFGSLLILILLSATSLPLVSKFLNISILQRLSLYLTPVVILFIIFTLGFFYIPTVKVKKRSIFIGAAISSLVWIVFKFFFNWYILNLTNIELIFGVLGAIPIFLIWIYANWMIILSGVIIVSILENRHIKPGQSFYNEKRIKITFEKVIPENGKEFDSSCEVSQEEFKSLIKEIVEVDKLPQKE